MNRRDFLSPGHLLHSAGQVVSCLDPGLSGLVSNPVDEIALVRLARNAMATKFEAVFPFGTPDVIPIGTSALDQIDQLESQLTVYRDTSEVSRMNRLAAYHPTVLEEGLFGLIDLAKKLSEETSGAFDISAGQLIRIWGFLRGPRRVPGLIEMETCLEKVGSDKIMLDPQLRSVYYKIPGLEINLGSIGKGYALDVVGGLLQKQQIKHFLIQGGYSSILANGCPQGGNQGWQITIRHPTMTDRTLGLVRLKNQGLATTANTFQSFEWQGKRLGHVLDPRSGWPASGMASSTVVARSGAVADALSTAFFVMGVEAARDYCKNHPGVGAILLEDRPDAIPVRIGDLN